MPRSCFPPIYELVFTPNLVSVVFCPAGRASGTFEQYDPQKDYGSYTIHGGEVNEK